MTSTPRTVPLWQNPWLWLIAGLALRLAYLTEQQASSVLFYQPLLDEQEMASTARQLLAGGGFGHEPLFKAPLYPLFLAATMFVSGEGWLFLARLAQHLCGGVLIWFAYDTARRGASGPGGRGRLAGSVAAAAVAFYAPLIRLEDSLILDFFAIFLQSGMLWALVRMRTTPHPRHEFRWAALAGLLAAASWLNRPTLTPLLPFLALWIAWGATAGRLVSKSSPKTPRVRRRVACAGAFLAIPLLAMALIAWRNAAVGNEAMVLPWQGGYSFYHANGIKANGKYYIQDSYALARTGNPTRELAEAGWREARAKGLTPEASAGRQYHAINAFWQNKTLREIREAPLHWLALMGKKLLYLASDREIFNFEAYEVHKRMSWILRGLPFSFGWLWPLALASAAWAVGIPRGRRGLFGLMWLYIILLGGAIAFYYVSGRLRMPLVFPAAVLAGCFLSASLSCLPGRRLQLPKTTETSPQSALRAPQSSVIRIALTAGLLLLGIAMSWGNWWGVHSESQRHIEYARLSNAAWRAGENEKALGYAERCEREHPGYPTTPLLRGQALYAVNRIDDAAAAFTESLKRLPEDPVAPYNLGIIAYYDRPDPRRAAAAFAEALRRQPRYAQAAWMEALAALRLGENERARELLRPWLPPRSAAAPEKLLVAATALYTLTGERTAAGETAHLISQAYGQAGLKRLEVEIKLIADSPMRQKRTERTEKTETTG